MSSVSRPSAAASARAETIRFEAADGHPLEGTLTTGPGHGPLALISAATAVKRGFYQKFAESLVTEHGFRAALTYDYRGTGGSVSQDFNPRHISMADWGMKDFPAALEALRADEPGRQPGRFPCRPCARRHGTGIRPARRRLFRLDQMVQQAGLLLLRRASV